MLISSAVALLLAQQLMVLLHEGAHSAAARVLGLHPTQFTDHVQTLPEPTGAAAAAVALAGPVFSLVTGALLIALLPRRAGTWWLLLATWFAFESAQECFGYLITTPLFSSGDVGAALTDLSAPAVVAWLCLAVGIAGMVGLAWLFSRRAVRWARDLHELRAMVVWGWLAGAVASGLLAVLYLAFTAPLDPAIAVFIVMGSFAASVFSPMAMSFSARARSRLPQRDVPTRPAPAVPVAGWLLLAAVVALNLFVFTRGVGLG